MLPDWMFWPAAARATPVVAAATVCGHTWPAGLHVDNRLLPLLHHRCDESAHPSTSLHRCRCGANTYPPDEHYTSGAHHDRPA